MASRARHRRGDRPDRGQPGLSPGLQGLGGPRHRPQAGGGIPGSARSRPTCSTRRRSGRRSPVDPTHVFITTWVRRATEEENVAANGALVRNLLAAVAAESLRHVALVTGLKHYLGPFETTPRPGRIPRSARRCRGCPTRISTTPRRTGLRGGPAPGLHLERPPGAHDHRLRPGQRHEHGRDPRRLRHDLPRDRPPLRLPRLAPSSGTG